MGQPSSSSPLETLLTVPQVAAHANISQRTVRRLIKAQKLACIRIGRSVRIRQADVTQLMTEGVK